MKAWMLLGIFIVVLGLALGGCVRLTDKDGKQVPLVVTKQGEYAVELKGVPESLEGKTELRAMVKGSIYKTGELTTVFATCLDGNDQPADGVVGFLSAWYPNGTAYLVNETMNSMQPGYFYRMQPMSAVGGTYLTEFRCFQNSSNMSALAWGEWQNPVWTNEIDQINLTTADTYALLLNISRNGVNFSQVEGWFNITWDKLDQMNGSMAWYYANLTQQISQVGQIANASVDRNDSYLAWLVVNMSCTTCGSSGTPVNFTEDADDVYYRKDWSIRVEAYSPSTGKKLKYPDVYCDIATSLTPGPTNMEVQGSFFTYSEFIGTRDDFTWTVGCYYT